MYVCIYIILYIYKCMFMHIFNLLTVLLYLISNEFLEVVNEHVLLKNKILRDNLSL